MGGCGRGCCCCSTLGSRMSWAAAVSGREILLQSIPCLSAGEGRGGEGGSRFAVEALLSMQRTPHSAPVPGISGQGQEQGLGEEWKARGSQCRRS